MISFSDIFKSSFLENFAAVSPIDLLMAILLSFALGLFILFVYKRTNQGVMASDAFGISLVALTMISAFVILAVTSNVVLSLGMVGALSIVRFRTAVKEPLDLVFLFWSITVGIICGGGLAKIALILSLALTLGILILDRLPVAKAPQILVVRSSDRASEAPIMEVVKRHSRSSTVKSRNMTEASLEMIVELRTDAGSELLQELLALEGVSSASLLKHDGEVTF